MSNLTLYNLTTDCVIDVLRNSRNPERIKNYTIPTAEESVVSAAKQAKINKSLKETVLKTWLIIGLFTMFWYKDNLDI